VVNGWWGVGSAASIAAHAWPARHKGGDKRGATKAKKSQTIETNVLPEQL